MTIQVYTHNEQEEKALLDFLTSRHYNYRPTDEVSHSEFLNEYNKDLDEGEAQIDAGNYYTHEEVKKIFADKRKRISGN